MKIVNCFNLSATFKEIHFCSLKQKFLLLSGSITCQMALPVISLSCCIFNNHNFFYQEPNGLAFNQDMCCHLALSLRLIIFHSLHYKSWYIFGGCLINQWQTLKNVLFHSPMRGNQQPVFAARWQQGSQTCFATFIWWKITRLLKTQQPLKLDKKNKHRFGISRILGIFVACLTKFKNNKFDLIKLPTDFYWKPSYLLCERAKL